MPRGPSQAVEFLAGEHAGKRRERFPFRRIGGVFAQQRDEAGQPLGGIAGVHEHPPPPFEAFAGGVSLGEPARDVCERDFEQPRFTSDFFRDALEAELRDAITRSGSDRIESDGHAAENTGAGRRAQLSR